jgi:hypothetical protein
MEPLEARLTRTKEAIRMVFTTLYVGNSGSVSDTIGADVIGLQIPRTLWAWQRTASDNRACKHCGSNRIWRTRAGSVL